MKKFISFDTYLGLQPKVVQFLSLRAIAYLSCKHVQEKTVRLHYYHSIRLPGALKKVELAMFLCFHNNQRNFFIYVFNNHFIRGKHFRCFVSGIYHFTLLTKAFMCVVLSLFKEIQTSAFQCIIRNGKNL